MQTQFDPLVAMYICSKSEHHSPLFKLNRSSENRHHLYKCANIDMKKSELIRCSFSTDIRSSFACHLNMQHKGVKYCCIYCSDLDNFSHLLPFDEAICLIRHIDSRHSQLPYQCSMCAYRAITADHVNMHQLFKHINSQQQGKILKCSVQFPSKLTQMTLFEIYQTYKWPKCSDPHLYQCLYCKYKHVKFEIVLCHLVQKHPNYPLLYYLPDANELMSPDKSDSSVSACLNNNNTEKCFCTMSDDDDDEDLREQSYVCFFCDIQQNKSSKQFRNHLLMHLFPSKTSHCHIEPFIQRWMKKYSVMQQSFYMLDNHQCTLCYKLQTWSDQKLKSPINIRSPKEHFILHSCFEPILCLLCAQHGQEFSLPNLKLFILQHLKSDHHRAQLKNFPELNSLSLFREKCKSNKNEQDCKAGWSDVKRSLINLGLITQLGTGMFGCLPESWSIANRYAFQILENSYKKQLFRMGFQPSEPNGP